VQTHTLVSFLIYGFRFLNSVYTLGVIPDPLTIGFPGTGNALPNAVGGCSGKTKDPLFGNLGFSRWDLDL